MWTFGKAGMTLHNFEANKKILCISKNYLPFPKKNKIGTNFHFTDNCYCTRNRNGKKAFLVHRRSNFNSQHNEHLFTLVFTVLLVFFRFCYNYTVSQYQVVNISGQKNAQFIQTFFRLATYLTTGDKERI